VGREWEPREYDASRRVVPTVSRLPALLKRQHVEQGGPKDGLVCPPLADWGSTGLLNVSWIAVRAEKRWKEAGLQPITLQEARHTAATWLDAVGVAPKNASVLMGQRHPRAPARRAARIRLARYTHALLDADLAERQHKPETG